MRRERKRKTDIPARGRNLKSLKRRNNWSSGEKNRYGGSDDGCDEEPSFRDEGIADIDTCAGSSSGNSVGRFGKTVSEGRKRGILALLSMLVILQSVIYFVKSGREENVSVAENDISGNVTAESVSVGKETSDNAVRAHAGSESRDYRKTDRGVERGKQYELFEFDPNTADSASFVMLGFSPKQAASILKYRRKGGIFRKREDFSKLYVVSDEKYRELEKYISIKSVAYSAGGMEGLLDLNAADSAALDALPGIGGYYSRKILEYRSRLGAFSDSKQLLEIYGFGKERYDGLEQYVYAGKVPKIRMTEADSAFLACHPYIGEYGCAAILEYVRFRRGREGNIFISFAELIENEIIKTDKLDYLRFVFE